MKSGFQWKNVLRAVFAVGVLFTYGTCYWKINEGLEISRSMEPKAMKPRQHKSARDKADVISLFAMEMRLHMETPNVMGVMPFEDRESAVRDMVARMEADIETWPDEAFQSALVKIRVWQSSNDRRPAFVVLSEEDYEAVPTGAPFVDGSGTRRVKPQERWRYDPVSPRQ